MQSKISRRGYQDACSLYKVSMAPPGGEEELDSAEELAEVFQGLGDGNGGEAGPPLDASPDEKPVTWSQEVGLNSGDAADRAAGTGAGIESFTGV